jgi:hypothetical protein
VTPLDGTGNVGGGAGGAIHAGQPAQPAREVPPSKSE